jgi:hypothetical protein
VASSNHRASRPRARIFRRALLAAVVAAAIGAAPASAFTIKPSFSSTPTAGQATTCLPNVLGVLPVGSVIHYSWGLWGSDEFATTSNSLTLSDTAGGRYLFCEVKVKLLGFTLADLGVINRVKGIAPSNHSLPSISGKKQVGQKVRCNPGSWSALPSSYSITWLRNGSPVSTGHQRKLTSGDKGQSIACSVKAHNPYGTSAVATSPGSVVH